MHSDVRSGLGHDMLLAALSAVALAGLLAWIFRAPSHGAEGEVRRDEPALGVVAVQVKDVRRRLDGMLVWNDVRQGDAVHDGDGIYVGDGGSAVVTLNAGGHIEIDDKSMVVLHPIAAAPVDGATGVASAANGNMGIDLRWGGASGVAAHAPMAIQMQGAHVQLEEGSRASLRVQPDASLAITVPSGKASIQMSHGPVVALHALEKRVVDVRTGNIGPALHLATALLAPAAAERTYVRSSNQSMAFSWQGVPKARGYTWELSSDNQFRHIVASRPTHATSLSYSGLESGTYYWRVRVDQGREHGNSEERAVVVINDRAPTPLGPRQGSAVDLSRKASAPTAKDLVLSWTPVQGVIHYAVEMVNTTSHATTLWRSAYAGLTVSGAELTEGEYCYRVRADEPERGSSPWSRNQCFRLLTKPVLKAPKLYTPDKADKPKETGWLWRVLGGVAHAAEGAPEALLLRWEEVEGAVAYMLEIATDKGIQHVVLHERVSDPYYRWQPPEARTYYWRVRAVDAEERQGDPSEVRKLDMGPALTPPATTPVTPSPPPQNVHPVKPPKTKPNHPVGPKADAAPGKAGTASPGAEGPGAGAKNGGAAGATGAVQGAQAATGTTGQAIDMSAALPDPKTWVGLRVALFTNWGDVTTFEPGAEFGAWLTPAPWGALGARLNLDYYTSQVTEESADHKITVQSRLHRLPITLAGLSMWPLRLVQLVASIGVRCAWTYTQTSITGQPNQNAANVEAGVAASFGAQRKVGPGALFAELSYAVTNQRTGNIQDAPDGLSLALGYRLGVF